MLPSSTVYLSQEQDFQRVTREKQSDLGNETPCMNISNFGLKLRNQKNFDFGFTMNSSFLLILLIWSEWHSHTSSFHFTKASLLTVQEVSWFPASYLWYICTYVACREHDRLPCWLSRGWQVSHQRWIWWIHCGQARLHASKGSTLTLKPRAGITRSPKQGNQWPHKKDMFPPKEILKKKFSFHKLVENDKNIHMLREF